MLPEVLVKVVILNENKIALSHGQVCLLCLNQAALLQEHAAFVDYLRMIASGEMIQGF